jgi:flavin reductase (DIM6/NTAB) family NADH-FMN oxidoreductase RutF
LISTLSPDGVANLASISFFTGAGRKLPTVCLNLQPRSDGVTLKDTFINIRNTEEFAFNIVTLEQALQMHRTAFKFPPEADEFVEVGLEKAPSVTAYVPKIAGAPISRECRLHKIISVGEVGDHMIIGEVLRFRIRDDLYLERGRIEIAAIHSVGCLAAEYTLAENVFVIPPDEEVLRGHAVDAHAEGCAPIDTKKWSAFGPTTHDIGETV